MSYRNKNNHKNSVRTAFFFFLYIECDWVLNRSFTLYKILYTLTHFSPVLHFIQKPVICFAVQASVCNFIKKETLEQVFSCEFCEISKNTFLQNTSGLLLLWVSTDEHHSVHWGINPRSKTPHPLSCLAPPLLPLKSANCPSPPFLGNPPPLYRFYVNSPPKSWIFQ